MKKMGIMFVILMLVACATKPEEQKFVNPIFYEIMDPLSTGTWWTQITPTSMTSQNKGTVLQEKCTLIENTVDSVTLQCTLEDQPSNILQYRFVLDYERKIQDGILVWLYDSTPGIPGPESTSTYTIPCAGATCLSK